MFYSFDTKIAEQYGVDCAVMINNLQYWILKNRACEKYFYDGHYWTYNSSRAFAEIFPFWNQRHIELIIKKLLDTGIIIKGNYNNSAYDRTLWYAFVDEDKWIPKNQNFHLQKTENGIDENCEPIINNKINNKTNMCDSEVVETKVTRPPTPTKEDVFTYAKQQHETAGMGGFECTKMQAEHFWSHYESINWQTGNGIPIWNWKAKLREWCAKDKRDSMNAN